MKSNGSVRRPGRERWFAIISAVLFFVVSDFWSGVEARPKPLFGDLPDRGSMVRRDHPSEKRHRRVKVEMESLAGVDLPDGAPTVGLNLFLDVDLTAVKSRFERRGARGFTWFGKVEGDPLGTVVLTIGDGLMRGLVFANGRHFEIRGAGAASQEVVEIDQSAFPREGCDQIPPGDQTLLEKPLVPSTQDQLGDTGAAIDTGEVIDVLVVYTPAARSVEGGYEAIQTLAQHSVDVTTESYEKSGIATRLNLVHAAEVPYPNFVDTSSGWNLALARLVAPSDGYMDNVHALRATYRADVVVLLVEGYTWCGLADAIMAKKETAFSLVARYCASSNYSLGHEIGHLQGARHDMYVDPTLGTIINGSPVDYNHGHVNLANRLRTVMAYADLCLDTAPYIYCGRVPYWSNPGVNYPLQPTDVPTGTPHRENNSRVLDNTAVAVANFLPNPRLTVQSTYPATGITITAIPPDSDGLATGSTWFQLRYPPNQEVDLTAPQTADGNHFVEWIGCASVGGPGNRTCTVTMDVSKTVTVNYFRDTVLRPTSFSLWTRGDTGQAAIREHDPSTGVMQKSAWIFSATGVGTQWQATSYSHVNGSTGYVLWTRSDTGQADLWKIDPGTGTAISVAHVYSASGIGAPWKATSYQHVGPSTGYLLWTRSDTGQAILWRIDPSAMPGIIPATSMSYIYSSSGVGASWQATSYQHVDPTTGYLLWTRSDTGQADLWRVDPSVMPAVIPATSMAHIYSASGVGWPWRATSYQQVGPSIGYLLWTRSDTGQADLWQVDPSVMPATIPATTLWASAAGAPYQATSYVPVNKPPTIDALPPVNIPEDYGDYLTPLSGITAGALEIQSIVVTAVSDNTALIPAPIVTYTSPATDGSLRFNPVANASGTATITVWLNDGQAANNPVAHSFTVTVSPGSDPPSDISLDSNFVDGNLDAGTTIGTFSTTDPDSGDTFLYELVLGDGDANNASFTIAGNVLKTSEPLDFKSTNPYSIRVRSTDQGGVGLSTDKIFIIVPPSYVLWSRSDTGQAGLWQLDPSTGAVTRMVNIFSSSGVGGPWQATSYAHVNGKEGYVLWSRSDTGQADLWKIDPRNGAVLSMANVFSQAGVGGPWLATSYAHVNSNEGYLLWTRSDIGRADLWKIDPSVPGVIPAGSMTPIYSSAGVGRPWQATSYSHVNGNEGYLLWTRSDIGRADLWKINPGVPGVIPAESMTPMYSSAGVGSPWQASSYQPDAADPSKGYLIWTRSDIGRADLWTVDPSVPGVIPAESMNPIFSSAGVGGPWQVTSYVR